MRGGRAYYYHYHLSRRRYPAKALHDRLCHIDYGLVSTATCCELAFMASAELFANAYDTYESSFGDSRIIPMPAGAATHGGVSPSFSQIMKLNSAERQQWEDAMSKEIEGLRQAGAIKSEEICEDSLPSLRRQARDQGHRRLVGKHDKARARWRGHPLQVALRC